MTVSRRLIILLAVPLAAVLGLGVFTLLQLSRIEAHSRFVAGGPVRSLAALGSIARTFTELRVHLRSFLLARSGAEQAAARSEFDAGEAELARLLDQYADGLISDDQDRRLLNEYRETTRDWIVSARKAMSLATEGRRDEALDLLTGPARANRLKNVSGDWLRHNEELAATAGQRAALSIGEFRWKTVVADLVALLLTGALGLLTVRRIVQPIQALEASVRAIAAGDYAKGLPFTDAADETGGLARSIDVLKQGAAAMEEQRWVKANSGKLTGDLQGAASLAEFGQRLLSGLLPLLGGGVAGVYVLEEATGVVRRVAAYGLGASAAAAGSFKLGEGIVGQCAQGRVPVTLAHLPPEYLRIETALGAAAPLQAVALPLLSKGGLLGVLEIASPRPFRPTEQALLAELLPVVAMSLEVLQGGLRTKESEERARLILESSAEGIFGVDTEGWITFVNPAACQLLGFAPEELVGQPSHATFHDRRPDGSPYPMPECPMFAAYTRGEPSRIDDECLWRKGGSAVLVEYGATPIRKDGAVVGAVVSFTDITVRKQREAALQKATKELEHTIFLADTALDLTKAGYWHVPLDGSGWYNSSERAARIFGDLPSPGHRYLIDDWAAHVREGDETAAKATMENFGAAVAGTIPVYEATYAYKRPVDGRVVWIHALGHVVKDASGRPTDMYGVTQDITDFHRLQAERLGARGPSGP